MGKVKDLYYHAHEKLKENIETAEDIVADFQSQLEQELTSNNDKLVQERLEKCYDKIAKYQQEVKEAQLKLMMEKQKLRDLQNIDNSKRFIPDDFNEEEAIVVEHSMEEIVHQNKELDKLEQKLYNLEKKMALIQVEIKTNQLKNQVNRMLSELTEARSGNDNVRRDKIEKVIEMLRELSNEMNGSNSVDITVN